MPLTRSQSSRRAGGHLTLEEELIAIQREVEEEFRDQQAEGSSSEDNREPFAQVVWSDSSEEEEEEAPVVLAMAATQRARFQYKHFHGKAKEDPDEWVEDFVGTAEANGEDTIKLTTLAGVLRGEARPWYKGLPAATKADWNLFRIAFLQEFRKVGEESEALIKIGQMRMSSEESVRSFLQRFQRVAKKIDQALVDSMLMRWFVSSLPKRMGVSVRQSHPTTLEEAVEVAQSYRSADISSSKSRKKKKYESSSSEGSSDSSSDKENSDSESDSSSDSNSESEEEKKSQRKKKKESTKKKRRSSDGKTSKSYKKVTTLKAAGRISMPSKEKYLIGLKVVG